MDKEEYYKRIEKINNRFKTDRVSVDEEYQLVCQKNYLSTKYIERLEQQCKKQKEAIDKATNELFILKDMIYKPETREENFEIQRKISSIIKRLNGKEVSK